MLALKTAFRVNATTAKFKSDEKKPNENGNRIRQSKREKEREIELETEKWKGKLNCRKKK